MWRSRKAKNDRERLRGKPNPRMEWMEARMDGIEGRFDGIHSVIREQGERLSRIEGMPDLHLGRKEDPAPLAPVE